MSRNALSLMKVLKAFIGRRLYVCQSRLTLYCMSFGLPLCFRWARLLLLAVFLSFFFFSFSVCFRVCFALRGVGGCSVAEFSNRDDMARAVRELDDTYFAERRIRVDYVSKH